MKLAKGFGEKTIATLTLVVEYETIDAVEGAKEVVEKAREYGAPVKAVLQFLKLTEVDLL